MNLPIFTKEIFKDENKIQKFFSSSWLDFFLNIKFLKFIFVPQKFQIFKQNPIC